MDYQISKLEKLAKLIEKHAPNEGVNGTAVNGLGTFKASQTSERAPTMDIPAIIVVGQGRKLSYIADETYDYHAGNVLVGFYPIPAEMEIVEATSEAPFLLAGVSIDMSRMADVLLRLDRIDDTPVKPVASDLSSNFAIPLNDKLLDPFIRLFELLENSKDVAMLSDSIVDEIYYRLVSEERGGELRYLLQQRGEIQRIAKVVDYIHQNLDQPIVVEDLATMVHMSRTAFYQNFKDVMHISPFQYVKSVKLYEAQRLIKEGKKANQAGYLVGYNSPAQFSREYKRHFGYAPSATVTMV